MFIFLQSLFFFQWEEMGQLSNAGLRWRPGAVERWLLPGRGQLIGNSRPSGAGPYSRVSLRGARVWDKEVLSEEGGDQEDDEDQVALFTGKRALRTPGQKCCCQLLGACRGQAPSRVHSIYIIHSSLQTCEVIIATISQMGKPRRESIGSDPTATKWYSWDPNLVESDSHGFALCDMVSCK